MPHPTIIQGGMGAGVSDWRLAQAVSTYGQLGVVSGTALDSILARRLQLGDEGGHMRRALEHFPVPEMAEHILEAYYIPGGKPADKMFSLVPMYTADPDDHLLELTILGNFVEVFLAKEGHDAPVGINYLEKIQMPHLPSMYGAMLAGIDYVIMGAGIPREIPGALDSLSQHQPASLNLHIEEVTKEDNFQLSFDPKELMPKELPPLKRPDFLAIVASATLAISLARKSTGKVNGFVIEGPTAGGHNAPPRGAMQLSDQGEPIYGPRDEVELDKIKKLGLPYWIAGGYARPEKLQEVLDGGGAGIQVGTAFFLCEESGVDAEVKAQLLEKLRDEEIAIFTDPVASPTNFPFKIVPLEGTLSQDEVYQNRGRICDLGYLQIPYKKEDGTVAYRCPSEPVKNFAKKGGEGEEVEGRKCLCNALMANIGLGQVRRNGAEKPLLTAGNDINMVRRFLQNGKTTYSASEVLDYLLS
ncbi:MAG: nitronate monooxygenase [Gemmatimonadetes bacterium]|nr:nitronate monooxygenase [Gemmatimonadota bacterium]